MPQSVSLVNSSREAAVVQNVENPTKKTPAGISAGKSTIQSEEQKKPDKTIFQRIKNSFANIIQSIKNLFLSIYYRILPNKKPVIIKRNESELKLAILKLKLEKVENFSKELLFKEADEYLVVFTHLGEKVYKNDWSNIWKFYRYVRNKFETIISGKQFITDYEIGKAKAQIDCTVLIPFLKDCYNAEISKLEKK